MNDPVPIYRMSRKKPAPDLIRGGGRFSEKDMRRMISRAAYLVHKDLTNNFGLTRLRWLQIRDRLDQRTKRVAAHLEIRILIERRTGRRQQHDGIAEPARLGVRGGTRDR